MRGMRLPNYTRVRLISDRYEAEGASRGAIGYIIEMYDDGAYELEFSDANGITFAQIVARREDVEVDEGSSHGSADQADGGL
jgi:hypothetical protein